MYASSRINAARARLDAARRRAGKPALREHSFGEVEERLNLLREAGSEPLPAEAVTFIENEMLMSSISFPYWAERYCTISSSDARLVPLRFRPSQLKLLAKVGELEESTSPLAAGKAALIIAKARRAGATVFFQAALAHGAMLRPQAMSFTASDTPEGTLKLYQIQERIYDNLPLWMRPSLEGGRVKSEHFHFKGLDSDLMFGFGTQKNPMGQGIRVDFVHLTEMSTWLYPDQVDDDLLPAFLGSGAPTCLFGIESTGKGGIGNWFYKAYQKAKSNDERYFRHLFLSWYDVPELHSLKNTDGISLKPNTLEIAARIKRETGFECSKEQLAWYQVTREHFEVDGKLDTFLQEYPASEEECFQHGVRSVFPIEVRQRIREAVRPPIFTAEWRDSEFEPIKLIRGDHLGKLLIYEKAKPGCVYVVGVDASYGEEGKDRAAVKVLRVANRATLDEEVASWVGFIAPDELALIAETLGKLYVTEGDPAKMAIEVNPGSPGRITQMELIKRGYENFYIWPRQLKVGGGFTNEIGWHTTPSTRPLLTETGHSAIMKGELLINSLSLIEEMNTFINIPNAAGRRHYEHASGAHDDELFALFIAFYVAHENETALEAEVRRTSYLAREIEVEKALKKPNWQAMAITADGEMVTADYVANAWRDAL